MNQKYVIVIMGKLSELEARIEALNTTKKEEVLLDSLDMQQLLRCSKSSLQRLRNNGDIPCTKVGRRYFYSKSFFTQEFINSIIKEEDPSKRFDY
jgi:hypothetical protein